MSRASWARCAVSLVPPPLSGDTRRRLEADLAEARAAFEQHPDDPDAIIWLGRRTAYLGRFVGDYELSGHVITVSLRGNALRLTVPGAPPYQLVPGLDGGFTLKELSSFGLKFVQDNDGRVTAALVSRPNGVVKAKRKE